METSNKIKADTIVWKYMDYPSFISLLIDKFLVFNRLDNFTDTLEGTLPKNAQKEYQEYLKTKMLTDDEAALRVKNEVDHISKYKKGTYANCWSIGNEENYALWKIYLKNSNDGVAIKCTIKRLTDCLVHTSEIDNNEKIIVKEVNYTELKFSDVNQINISTTKDVAYRYEDELRLLIKNQRDLKKKIDEQEQTLDVILIPVDVQNLIEKIYISPFAKPWLTKTTLKILKQLNYENITIDNSRVLEK
ncbi:MAG: hypothetical protein ACKVOQ_14230 [Cyclobacteriaceae bacterium]